MSSAPETATSRRSPSLAAFLVLLPAALPAAGLLAWSPAPQVDGAGLALLASLPAGLLGLVRLLRADARGGRRRLAALVGLAVVLAAAWTVGSAELDPFGARRARALLAAGALAFLGAASLRASERPTLVLGVAALGLVYGLPAVLLGLGSAELGWAGVLGNAGPMNQVLVPAGGVALALLARVRGPRARTLSLLCLATAAAHAALAPVHAGLVSLSATAFVVTLLSTVRASVRLVPFALAVALALLAATGGSREPGAAPAEEPGAELDGRGSQAAAASRGELGAVDVGGGVSIRLSLARASLAMWRAEGGVGAGRFRAAFPPYREVEETERSRDGVCAGGVRAVAHPHDDWLLGLVELGLVGGLAWIASLALGLVGAVRLLRRGSAGDAALAAGLVALLVNALAHAPLLVAPGSALLGFALLGAVAGARTEGARERPSRETSATRAAAFVVGGLALLALPSAAGLWSHGRALTRAAVELRTIARALDAGTADDPALTAAVESLRIALDDARESAPDSALALALTARFAPPDGGARMEWQELLERRPHSFEALYELGLDHAAAGEDDRARARWEQALALQPTHPVLLRNLARLAFHAGDDVAAEAHLALVQRNGCLAAGWIEALGAELVLAGRAVVGRSLMARGEPRLTGADASWVDALGREARQAGDGRRADALSLLANLAWARSDVEANRLDNAVRLYRQALNRSRRHTGTGADAYALEFAAALMRAGDGTAAAEVVAGRAPGSLALEALPAWVQDELAAAGLVDAAAGGG